jgi:predicted acylesterase/phospholipase RssA
MPHNLMPVSFSSRITRPFKSRLRILRRALAEAEDYEEWYGLAQEYDLLSGGAEWREMDKSEDYPFSLLYEHLHQINRLLQQRHYPLLITFLQESLHRTLGELSSPILYRYALCGTKKLIERYLTTVANTIELLCSEDIPGISLQQKLELLNASERNFGRSALMLSGGGTFGIYHIGVVKTLHEHRLLPSVICGSSMGSIIAGLLAVNNDEELDALLADVHQTHHSPLGLSSLSDIFRQKALLDSSKLQHCIETNLGDLTFKEAFEHTGREVSLTVSPTRSGQKPRILNYLTAPNALLSHASRASCAIPGLFSPVKLKAKNEAGFTHPYMASERWVDGSFAADVPQQRIGRLHNVNYFIVSQANPHILPFISYQNRHGLLPTLTDVATRSFHSQVGVLFDVAHRRIHSQGLKSWLNLGASIFNQDYQGDITLHPAFPLSWYGRFLKNPSPKELDFLMLMGERTTWPKLAMIRDQTLISQTLHRCRQALEKKGTTASSLSRRSQPVKLVSA